MKLNQEIPPTAKKAIVTTSVLTIAFLLFLVILMMWGCPRYRVYSQRKEGEAMLAHSVAAKEVMVNEAKAKFEAAAYLTQADTVRAHGIARSNQIIGNSLKENQDYLKWLWIDKLDMAQSQVIYVATETNMPIMEAGRSLKIKPAVVPEEK